MTLENLFDKILHDRAFRKALKQDPKKALEVLGFEPTLEIIQHFKRLDYNALEVLGRDFDRDFVC